MIRFSGYLSLIRLQWTSTTAEFQISHGAALALGSVDILQQELHLPLPLTPHRIERHIHAATQGATVPIIRGPNLELDQGIRVLGISLFGPETSKLPKNWIWLYTKKKQPKVWWFCIVWPHVWGGKEGEVWHGPFVSRGPLAWNSIGGNSLGNASEHHGLPLPACTKEAFSKKKITYRQSFGLLQIYPSIFKRAIDRNPISTLQFIDIKIAGSCGHFLPIHMNKARLCPTGKLFNYLFRGVVQNCYIPKLQLNMWKSNIQNRWALGCKNF